MSVWTQAEIQANIAALKVELSALSVSLVKTRDVQQHRLDTGQSSQMVMRQQIGQLENSRKRILSEIDYWKQMLTGCADVRNVRPGW